MVRKYAEDKSEQQVLDDIARVGWHCVHIMAEGELVEYTFTIGLYETYKHPELIIFGLPAQTAHDILSTVIEAAQNGSPLDLSQPSDALIDNFSCFFVKVPVSEYHENVGYCIWYYEGSDFPMFQIVWPSRSGQFPWHSQATEAFRTAQPVLGQPSSGT